MNTIIMNKHFIYIKMDFSIYNLNILPVLALNTVPIGILSKRKLKHHKIHKTRVS